MTREVRARVPWWLKIGLKIILNRLPVPYRFWKKLGLFQHGEMDQGAYSLEVFRSHHALWGAKDRYHCLELGPGDSVSTALVAHAHGAERTLLVDSGPWASLEVGTYQRVADVLKDKGLAVPPFASFDAMLDACGASYHAEGLASLRALPEASVDYIFSQAVFEHVRLHEFPATMAELRRILRQDGLMTHRVDLKDHLAKSLNNLRFQERRWEAPLMAESGFYTNRIRMGRMVELMEEAGFDVELAQVDRWPVLPVPRHKLAPPFRDLPEEELKVSGFLMVCRPKAPVPALP
jgi:SAM-dependent methyltransferase